MKPNKRNDDQSTQNMVIITGLGMIIVSYLDLMEYWTLIAAGAVALYFLCLCIGALIEHIKEKYFDK